ncbi:uncharacterized protein LOC127239824 [Andrographis paniculata]|uniref:uncharacterized protein LOC127239824 n=1 Tax=Andrographis paniculata TaxID=175694 RepID=UPI0021E76282|nr:uncharacterized protein LOC127239824 [Andrographis paniculata]
MVAETKNEDSKAEENGVRDSEKSSKKRKRKDSEEKENQVIQDGGVEESKPKNLPGTEEGKEKETHQGAARDISDKGTNGSAEATLNNKGVDKSESKSAKKQRKDSDEPKSVNAFQRVKIDEVKFADERLQDNSYWAKDGAEIGYGAKAQEVLGQVKGRDFRHEKTKKKRGSYRGGQIDLQSHSIKFNYSEEEEED